MIRFSLYGLLKSCADRVVALLALLLLSQLLVFVALLVRWHLGAPVLFRQQRPGYLGRPFWLLKFRTMTNGPLCQETYQYSSARPRVRNTHGQIQSPWPH
jgi:lipopolysaccharide/colanic/teichoic acid biosynthesis glycosyltransferase